jgi:hypothetical protein
MPHSGGGDINFDFVQTASENIYLTEFFSLGRFLSLENSIAISEDTTHSITKALTGEVFLTESMSFEYGTAHSEAVYLSEQFSFTKQTVLSLEDTLELSEVLTKLIEVVYADNLYLSEEITKKMAFSHAENIYITEEMTEAVGKIYADALCLSEEIQMDRGTTFLENLYLQETFTREIDQTPYTEDFLITETYQNALSISGADVFNVTELTTFQTLKTLEEEAYLDETFSMAKIFTRNFQEDVYLSEQFSIERPFWWAERVVLSEILTKRISISFHEELSLAEQFNFQMEILTDRLSVSTEEFSKEHYAETIKSMERPYVVQVKCTPVLLGVRGYREVSDHADNITWLVRASDSVETTESSTHT